LHYRMPVSRFFATVSLAVALIVKEAGPEIFCQSHSLIVPSGSLEAEPSNEILSVGKVITWSGPAMAIGGLLFSLQPSHDFSFLQEIKIPAAKMNNARRMNIFFHKKALRFAEINYKNPMVAMLCPLQTHTGCHQ